MKELSEHNRRTLLKLQESEVTESIIYQKVANFVKKPEDKETLLKISADEKVHAAVWKSYTGIDMKPNKGKITFFVFLARVFGYTFALKKLENGEKVAQVNYEELSKEIPEAIKIKEDESIHEAKLLNILDEERLMYVGSMVLGLNDALVELTGTIAGLTFAFQDTKLVALSGLITGIAATLSMASSEFLSARAEGRPDALKSCTYTGIAYLVTVALLVTPYLIFPSHESVFALAAMICIVLLIIVAFNYYIAVAKDESFKKRFIEMASISLGVAFISFLIGLAVKQFLGVDI